MQLINVLDSVLKDQQKRFRKSMVDITLVNGNILLRSFHVYDIDLENEVLTGLTAQEAYAHSREGREPVYCHLKFSEIKELSVPELGVEYSQLSVVE